MAAPVEFRTFTPKGSRTDLMRKLESAPEDHCEAVLSAYDLLQIMHENGSIDLVKGLMSASGAIIDKAADVGGSKESVAALRIGLMVSNLLRSIDANRVHALLTQEDDPPPTLLALARVAFAKNTRRGLYAAMGLLSVLGAALGPQASDQKS